MPSLWSSIHLITRHDDGPSFPILDIWYFVTFRREASNFGKHDATATQSILTISVDYRCNKVFIVVVGRNSTESESFTRGTCLV